jgi:hypothetical protein
MMRDTTICMLAALGMALPAAAGGGGGFAALAEDYETVRSALLHDTLEGVGPAARELAAEAGSLAGDVSAARLGVPPAAADEATALLPKVAAGARAVAGKKDLTAARAAFGELSATLIRLQELVPGSDLVVAYCPMAKASWLQPDDELGNPYMGQRMARCGSVKSR